MKKTRIYSDRELILPLVEFYKLDLEYGTPLYKALYDEAKREIAWREGWNEAVKKMKGESDDRPEKNREPVEIN